jgi:hypothetical protein
MDPYIFLSDPNPWIRNPELRIREANYKSGRIRVLPGLIKKIIVKQVENHKML